MNNCSVCMVGNTNYKIYFATFNHEIFNIDLLWRVLWKIWIFDLYEVIFNNFRSRHCKHNINMILLSHTGHVKPSIACPSIDVLLSFVCPYAVFAIDCAPRPAIPLDDQWLLCFIKWFFVCICWSTEMNVNPKRARPNQFKCKTLERLADSGL